MASRYFKYMRMTAAYDTPADKTICGHAVRCGDRIGFDANAPRRVSRVICNSCLEKYIDDLNSEAEQTPRRN